MANYYYDYNNVDSTQVTSMLSDLGINDLYHFVDSHREPYQYGHTLSSADSFGASVYPEWNAAPEYHYPTASYDDHVYDANYYPSEHTSPLPLDHGHAYDTNYYPLEHTSPVPLHNDHVYDTDRYPSERRSPVPLDHGRTHDVNRYPSERRSPAPLPYPVSQPTRGPVPLPSPPPSTVQKLVRSLSTSPSPRSSPIPSPVPIRPEPRNITEIIRKYDRNGNGRISADDIEAVLRDLGVGVLSSKLAQVLFELVDQNKNGVLDPPEVLALAAIMDKLNANAASPARK